MVKFFGLKSVLVREDEDFQGASSLSSSQSTSKLPNIELLADIYHLIKLNYQFNKPTRFEIIQGKIYDSIEIFGTSKNSTSIVDRQKDLFADKSELFELIESLILTFEGAEDVNGLNGCSYLMVCVLVQDNCEWNF